MVFINICMEIIQKILEFIKELFKKEEPIIEKEFIMENQISKNFTLAELTYSDTAKSKGLDNTPTESEYMKMKTLCEKVLQPLRDHFGKPIRINSCYRGKQLNEAVGGSKTSQHCKGEAADIEIMGMSNYDLACYIRDNMDFDQLILEYTENIKNDINAGWVHVSYVSPSTNRKQCLTINKSGTKLGF